MKARILNQRPTLTVDEAESALAQAHIRKAREDLAQVVASYLGGKPMACNMLIEGCMFQANEGVLTVRPRIAGENGKRIRSAASLAKQAAAMRKVWRAKRRAQKGKK